MVVIKCDPKKKTCNYCTLRKSQFDYANRMIVLSIQYRVCIVFLKKEHLKRHFLLVRMNVSDRTYELCFDLFMGTSSITSNLEPRCAKQKKLVDSHRLLNQCLYNSIESNHRNEEWRSTSMQEKTHRFECCNILKCSLRLVSDKPDKPQKILSLAVFMWFSSVAFLNLH